MRLLSWNVQWCRGVDGRVDPGRIAAEVRGHDADVICLQEVAVNFPDLKGNDRTDQVHVLAHGFPGYAVLYVAGVDLPGPEGRRSHFGNVLFSRLPVGRVLRHSLPWPPDAGKPSMPRVAVEAMLQAPWGLLRVLTTHLEYHSNTQRAAQVARLREIHIEACGVQMENAEPGGFRSMPRPSSAVLCGDFNMPPEDRLCQMLQEELGAGIPRFVDAWRILKTGEPHAPTFCVHDRSRGQAPHCRDYIFATEDLAPRLKAIRVDALTRASDHQPVIIEIG